MDPIIIIGAPRSGTKMLRELLKLHPEISGALHEEERVWSYGNRDKTSQPLFLSDLTPKIKKHIREHYRKKEEEDFGKWIVAKNVANSLRVEFVHEIFPKSPFIHIVRDGRDCVPSAIERWNKPLDLMYLIKNGVLKNKKFPIKEMPFFLIRQVRWVIRKLFSKEKRLKWWGPKFHDSSTLFDRYSLIELCGIQWSRCFDSASSGLERINSDLSYTIRYEDLTSNPIECMHEVFNFLKLSSSKELENNIIDYVKPSNKKHWKEKYTKEEYNLLLVHIEKSLIKSGYSVNETPD